MELSELLEHIKNWKPTPEEIEQFNCRMKEMNAKFEKEAWDRRITQEWLNRSYSI